MSADRFAQRKAAQGYRSPGQRDGCCNCSHHSTGAITFDGGRATGYDCTLGKFLVVPQGICERYAPAGQPGFRCPSTPGINPNHRKSQP